MIVVVLSLAFILGCSNEAAVQFDVNDAISIPVSSITNTVQKFEFDADGTIVRYFAVRGGDGEIKTAFDACDVCGGSKGYVQQGGDIACVNCGRVFDINGLGTQNKGYGCWPSFLSHVEQGGNVMISKSELAAGKHRFV